VAFNVSYIISATDRFSATGRKIADSMNRIKSNMESLQTAADKTSKKFKSMAGAMAPVSVGVAGLAGASVMAAAKMETMQTAFTTMTGSAENAALLMQDLRRLAAKTPFELEGIGASTKQLLAFGVQQKDVVSVLTDLGDIAAGANVPLQDMASIYGKMKAKGKAMTEELLQMSDRGIPIIDVLAKQMGVAKDRVFDLASESKISFKDVTKAMASMTGKGGIFFNQMEAQSQTLSGKWSTLTDAFTEAGAVLGDQIVKTTDLKNIMDKVTQSIGDITAAISVWMMQNPQMAKLIIYAGLLVAALTPILLVFAGIAAAVGILAPLGAAIAGISIAGLAGAAVFLGWVAAIGAVVYAGWWLYKNWDEVWRSISDVIGGTIESIIMRIEALKASIAGMISSIVETIKTGLLDSPIGFLLGGVLEGGSTEANINVNINDKGGNVGNVSSSSSGNANVNVGKNMAGAGG